MESLVFGLMKQVLVNSLVFLKASPMFFVASLLIIIGLVMVIITMNSKSKV